MKELSELSGFGDEIKLRDEVSVFKPEWEMRGLVVKIEEDEPDHCRRVIIITMIVIEALRSLQKREDVGKTVRFEVSPQDESFCRYFKRVPGEKEFREADRAARHSG